MSRYYRMRGYNVLHPMGWDAFGLPAENAAIKAKTNPAKLIADYSANYKRQFALLGISFDWSREINSSQPNYYRWTQWIFLQLYKAWYDPRVNAARPIAELEKELAEQGTRAIPSVVSADALTAEQWRALSAKERNAFLMNFRLAYRKAAQVNWCPSCKTVLANEEVSEGKCWRCGSVAEKKTLMQWFFRITAYADRLVADLDTIDWPEHIKLMQRNWIGRSEGAEVQFPVISDQLSANSSPITDNSITVFTTRPDTLWGATFMVLAPEHPLVEKLTTAECRAQVEAYVAQAKRETEAERAAVEKEKTGVFIGAYATNPVNGARIPIWVADYVMMGYGTGAIMAVPAHDERDFAFALKFGLPILPVIERTDPSTGSGLAKSFALGGTMRDGFADALRAEGIPFEEKQGSLYITIPPAKMTRYVEIAQQFVQPGEWNEVVGARWLFIFGPNDVETFGGMESEKRILARCHALEPDVRGKRTVMEMLYAVEFYHDALFHAEYGAMINSDEFSGTPGNVAVHRVTQWLQQTGKGTRQVNYKLRDWGISRQRYWGTPIPIIHTDRGEVPVDEKDLPVKLPDVESYEPSATGESPLATIPKFVNVTLPDGTPGRRETDTMGTFACSSWYFMRFADPHNDDAAFDPKQVAYWLPVDTYVGGAEHAVMHLLYARFWTKVLHDLGYVPFVEPFTRLRNQGMILAPEEKDGKREKMSKSKGNVITPDEVVKEYGADALRAYEMFISDFEQATPWSTQGLGGTWRWLRRVWDLLLAPSDRPAADATTERADRDLRRAIHKANRKVSADIEGFRFNTVVSAMMEFTNVITDAQSQVSDAAFEEARHTLLLLLAPIAPFMAEEIWARKGRKYSVHQQKWPQFDAMLAADEMMTLPIMVNGKVRDRVELPVGVSEIEVKDAALRTQNVQKHLAGKTPAQVIYVPGRMVSIVVR